MECNLTSHIVRVTREEYIMAKFRNITVDDVKFKWTFTNDGAYIKCDNEKFKGNHKANCGSIINGKKAVTPKDVAKWITENIFKMSWVETAVKQDTTTEKVENSQRVIGESYILIKRSWYTIEQHYNLYNDEVIFVSDDPKIIITLFEEYNDSNEFKDWNYENGESHKVEYIKIVSKKVISL